MANLDITQRNSLERSTLASNDSLRHGAERGSAIYSLVAIAIGGFLAYTAVAAIEDSTQWYVLGVIFLTVIGFMAALSPTRRGI
jgi:hypothetical protein